MLPKPPFPVERVFLDLGHVLFSLAFDEAIRNIADASTVDLETIKRYFNYNPTHIAYETGKLSSDEFFQTMANEIGYMKDMSSFRQFWLSLVQPIEANFQFARELATRYPVGVISNVGEAHMNYVLDTTDLAHFTDLRIYSYTAGVMKPDARIYHHALTEANLPAERCVFIDDKADNIAGANAIGIRGYTFPEDTCLRTFWETVICR